jgi:hypothetical protein
MILLLATLCQAAVLIEPEPVVGQESTITVLDDLSRPISGATVRAVHRADLPGERDLAVGLTDARGRVYWTPSTPGLTRLRARDDEQPVIVTGPVPVAPAVLLAFAALLALGAAVVGLWPRQRPEA